MGWRYAGGTVFRQSGDWFISMLPSLLWEQGAIVRMIVKPMALDPLFWDIVGLKENERLPLSFRGNGAWVLQPPSADELVGPNTMEVEPLAQEILDWGNRRASEILESISVESMIAALPSEQSIRGQHRAVATCLHVLAGDMSGAISLCQIDDPDANTWTRESGGFSTRNLDGSTSSFLDQAADWIARKAC